MNETIITYINTPAYLYLDIRPTIAIIFDISLVISIVFLLLLIGSSIASFINAYCDGELSIGENIICLLGTISIVIAIASGLFVYTVSINPEKLEAQGQIVPAIENEYKIQICDSYKEISLRREPVIKAIKTASPIPNDDCLIKVSSKNPDNSNIYTVYLLNQNGTWGLYRITDDGDTIPLNPDHTIQDLKEK